MRKVPPKLKADESSLTHERALALLNYDQNTGEFSARQHRPGNRFGQPLGNVDPIRGYVRICIAYHRFMAHRLAWFYVTGKWPTKFIDHIDGNPTNNRFSNLREADVVQNGANRGRMAKSGAPYKGVHFHKHSPDKPWQSSIRVRGKLLYLGRFVTPEEARDAYMAAAEKHFGEFRRAA